MQRVVSHHVYSQCRAQSFEADSIRRRSAAAQLSAPDWRSTGAMCRFYVGLNGGYGWTDVKMNRFSPRHDGAAVDPSACWGSAVKMRQPACLFMTTRCRSKRQVSRYSIFTGAAGAGL